MKNPSSAIVLGLFLTAGLTTHAGITVIVGHNANSDANPGFKFSNVPSPSTNGLATNVKFVIVDGERDPNGGEVDKLNDGQLPTGEDQPEENFFFNAGTSGGRLEVDLGGVTSLRQINTYSWHPNTRGPQVYTLYASDGTASDFNAAPKSGMDPQMCGWKLKVKVNTKSQNADDDGGQYCVSISDTDGVLGKYRYLLFDMARTENDDDFGNTFYSRIDVIGVTAPLASQTGMDQTDSTSPINEALPLVGTDAHGHAYPGATVPFGMVQLSPDTPLQGWDASSGYHYSDSTMVGFSHTHLSGTGCGCLGDVLLMPTVGKVYLTAGSPSQSYCSRFSHDQEHATPGYYSVFLKDPKVTAELTATERCGFHKYTFPESDQAHIILDLVHGVGNDPVDASLKVEGHDTLVGYRISNGWGGRRAVYFAMQFSKAFDSFGIERDGRQLAADAQESSGREIKAFVNYKTAANEAILVKVGISGTSIEGARKNLAAEILGWDFEAVKSAAAEKWEQVFNTVQIQTFDPHIRTTFYANLYLSCLAPVLFNDVDGTYRGYDHQNHAGTNFQNYTTFSIWDIYRAQWPLLTILHPNRVNDMVQSMLAGYQELDQHTTPIWPLWGNETWCMIGYHSADMIADAYLDGFHGFDAEAAYQALRDTAMQDRNGLKTYKELGYVASRPGEQATSKTLEYTFDDWCIARMAQELGHGQDAQLFYQRSANYRNLFDTTTQFFRGRKANGAWRVPFIDNALVGDEYTEADAWQYAFDVQQNAPDLIALFGGDQGFIQKMDTMFVTNSTIYTDIPDISGRIGQYSQGDEQSHHVAYLYDYAGAPYKTQQHIRQIMSTMYDDTPAGQCGNVDCGQMAAWYIFSALGFYPMNPDSGVYAIGSPVVSKAVIHLNQDKYLGHTFTVTAKNNSSRNIYIQSVELNGKPLSKPWLTYEQITSGGTLDLVMGPNPNLAWGSAQEDRPPATMPADFHYPALPVPASDKLVRLRLPIRVACGSDEPIGEFVPDPNMVAAGLNHADPAIDTSVPHAAPFGVYQSECYGKDFAFTFPVPAGEHYLVRLHFAEIFDSGAGARMENIAINGQLVLTNFDIFAAAGGKNKAVVKEFSDIASDAQGNIVIHIMAPPDSPDQNAKISGIEILDPASAGQAASLPKFDTKTADGKCVITINTTAAPELKDWAEGKLAPVLAEWYPKIVAQLASEGFNAPAHFSLTLRPMDGVAYTSGTKVVANSTWLGTELQGEAIGSLVHEMVHVVQQFDGDNPDWLVEGSADYVRWFEYEPQSHGADIVWMQHLRHFSPRYDASYRVTANFLDWVTQKYDKDIVAQLNAAMREGKYNEDLWKQYTGKTVQDLGAEWKQEVESQLGADGPSKQNKAS
jgi:predicted alpha-1,2-mannosidase